MGTRYARKPLPIDHKKSRRWGIASLGSIGVGIKGAAGVGLQLFDLINLSTGRAHSFYLANGGVGYSFGLPVSGSVGTSDYADFTTSSDVNFFDFDGTFMTVRETNALVYSWTHVSFWRMTVTIADGGFSVPGLGVSSGFAKFVFSDGKPMGGDYEMEAPQLHSVEPLQTKSALPGKEDSAGIRLPSDILFGFDKYRLKDTTETHKLLWEVIQAMEKTWRDDHKWVITGHTDSIGSLAYNKGLAKRRAESVADYLRFFKHEWKGAIKTEGVGETDPVASNATDEGRARNRRVEIWNMPTKFWKHY